MMSAFQFPEEILDLINPLYLPPALSSPQSASSLNQFWSECWHSILKRTFVVAGGKPLVWITKKVGGSTKLQRLAGLIGIYLASAVVHKYR